MYCSWLKFASTIVQIKYFLKGLSHDIWSILETKSELLK
jgi:hypothetical protein